MKVTREHGRIMSVETKFRGDALAEDALAGATTLVVGDAGDFDEDGGWLTINGQVVEFTECDDDEGTITLAEGLTAAAEQGDAVHLWSEFYQEPVDYQEILVELDGEYDNPETVVAELADGLPELPEGDRGRAAESCVLLRVSDDEWEVVNVGGRPKRSAGMHAEANDVYTITAADVTASTATMTLSHTPIDESVKGFWGVLPQEPTEYTVSGQTVTWPLGGVAVEGDRLWVHYWYRVEGAAPGATADGPESVVGFSRFDSANSTYTLPYPAGTQQGDLLLMTIASNGTVTTPSGWTLLGTSTADDQTMSVCTRTAGTETSVLNQHTGGWLHQLVVAYRGATVSGAASTVATTNTTSWVSPTGPAWNVACILVGYGPPPATTPAADGITEAGTQSSMAIAHTDDGSAVTAALTTAKNVSGVMVNLVGG